MRSVLFIAMRLIWKPWELVCGELKIRRALGQLNAMIGVPWGTYDRFEIRSASRYVTHTITGANHPPYWDGQFRRAARISEDMRHPRGIGCSPSCRHNRAS